MLARGASLDKTVGRPEPAAAAGAANPGDDAAATCTFTESDWSRGSGGSGVSGLVARAAARLPAGSLSALLRLGGGCRVAPQPPQPPPSKQQQQCSKAEPEGPAAIRLQARAGSIADPPPAAAPALAWQLQQQLEPQQAFRPGSAPAGPRPGARRSLGQLPLRAAVPRSSLPPPPSGRPSLSQPPTPCAAAAQSSLSLSIGGPGGSDTTPQALLQAASNLTVASDCGGGGRLAYHRPTTSMDEPAGQRLDDVLAALEVALPPIQTVAPAVAASAGSAALTVAQQHGGGWASHESPAGPDSASPQAQAAAAYRVPIYNQDGRLVGYKQNSTLRQPGLGYGSAVGSGASSPNRGLFFSADYTECASAASADCRRDADASVVPVAAAPSDVATAGETQPAIAVPAVPAEFESYAVLPHLGFSSAEDQLPGYVLGPVLGRGGFCVVRKALHLLTRRSVAVKIIDKGRLKDPKDRDRVDREARVMRHLSNHVALIRLLHHAETPGFVYLVMEHAVGGSLLDHVRARRRLPEPEAARLLQQLLAALACCHARDVVHRDVKLENVLLDGEGDARLIDFGLCGYYASGKSLRCHCGSPSYAAPEIVARSDYLAPPVDVWSLGVVLFACLAGYLPFHAKEKKQLSQKILAGSYKAPGWLSPGSLDLLSRMLCLDPSTRATLEEVYEHPWTKHAGVWAPPGTGPQGLLRLPIHPLLGTTLPDELVIEACEALGVDSGAVRRGLRAREASAETATYYLLSETLGRGAGSRDAPMVGAEPAACAAAPEQPAPKADGSQAGGCGGHAPVTPTKRAAAASPVSPSADVHSSPARGLRGGSPLAAAGVGAGAAVLRPLCGEGFVIKAVHPAGDDSSTVAAAAADTPRPAGGEERHQGSISKPASMNRLAAAGAEAAEPGVSLAAAASAKQLPTPRPTSRGTEAAEAGGAEAR